MGALGTELSDGPLRAGVLVYGGVRPVDGRVGPAVGGGAAEGFRAKVRFGAGILAMVRSAAGSLRLLLWLIWLTVGQVLRPHA